MPKGITTFHSDDIISFKGEEYLVLKPNPANLKCRNLKNGDVWNIPRYAVTFVRTATAKDLTLNIQAVDTALYLGTPVRFKNNPKEGTAVFVVIGIGTNGVKIAKLGGQKNYFYKNVQHAGLDVVPLSQINM